VKNYFQEVLKMYTKTMFQFDVIHIVKYRPIAREQVDKHVSMEVDSWKPTRYRTRSWDMKMKDADSWKPTRRCGIKRRVHGYE
jgi:hypothetical protein